MGYIIDIYSGLPHLFWFGICAVYFFGCILVLQKCDYSAIMGRIILLLNYSTIFIVPYAFGYYCYGDSDELTHLGELSTIISSGHIDVNNIYPAIHIIYAFLIELCALDINMASFIYPFHVSFLFILGLSAMSRNYTRNDTYLLRLIFLCSLPYYMGAFHLRINPNGAYFMFIPLFFYILSIYLSHRTLATSVALVVSLLVVPFGHTFIFLFLAYLLFLLSFISKSKRIRRETMLKIQLLLIITATFWVINNVNYLSSLRRIYYKIIESNLDESIVTEGMSKAYMLDLSYAELTRFVYIYLGRYLIPMLFAAIILTYVAKKKRELFRNNRKLVYISIRFAMVFGLFVAILLFNPIMAHTSNRIVNMNYIIFAIIPLFAISLCALCNMHNHGRILSIFILTFIFISTVFGVFCAPHTYLPNIATTYNEVDAAQWLFDHKGRSPIYDLVGDVGFRFCTLFYGLSEYEARIGKDILRGKSAKIQDHFGYDITTTFNEFNKTIILTTKHELVYQTAQKAVGRYNEQDFETFRADPNVYKIYDSLNADVYKSRID